MTDHKAQRICIAVF